MPAPARPIRCTTRAWKNARFLKETAPETFAKTPNAQGFGTGIPVDILRRLHRLAYDAPELKDHPAVCEFLKQHKMPVPGRSAR
jgi:hypothetical protein